MAEGFSSSDGTTIKQVILNRREECRNICANFLRFNRNIISRPELKILGVSKLINIYICECNIICISACNSVCISVCIIVC